LHELLLCRKVVFVEEDTASISNLATVTPTTVADKKLKSESSKVFIKDEIKNIPKQTTHRPHQDVSKVCILFVCFARFTPTQISLRPTPKSTNSLT